jgi:ribosomal protein L9
MKLLLNPFKCFELLASAYGNAWKFKEGIVIDKRDITRTKTAKSTGLYSSNLKLFSIVNLSNP